MYKTLLLSLTSTFFIGCSSTNALQYFQKDTVEARAIQYTKKTDIIHNNEQKVLFWGTYLNNIEKTYSERKKEAFVVTTYFTNSNNQDIKENNYFITLNGQKHISMELIDKSNDKLKPYTLKNPWASHYIVIFNEQKEVYKLNLKLEKDKSNWAQLEFEK